MRVFLVFLLFRFCQIVHVCANFVLARISRVAVDILCLTLFVFSSIVYILLVYVYIYECFLCYGCYTSMPCISVTPFCNFENYGVIQVFLYFVVHHVGLFWVLYKY
jgi:hypothetical protein